MVPTRSVALLAVLTAVGIAIAPLASGAIASPFVQGETGDSETATTNASVGTLMQASAADTESTVESGMFEAAYEHADTENRSAIVRNRAAELEAQVDELEAERDRLRSRRDKFTRSEYQSRMAKLTVEMAGLERSIERAERRAGEVGVSESRLATLQEQASVIRQNASEQAGSNISAMARGLAGSDGPPGFTTKPPADPDQPGNDGKPETVDDPRNGSGTGAPDGPPADSGSPTEKTTGGSNTESGSGTESGSSTETRTGADSDSGY
ncbi:hypothetical protein [Natrinema halophilum]|uniref:Uncharacterized protein n=1 Tax=Natrinema halophilum TaxID=1699371 RepID=A0A7D5L3J7_9EURY|nr:hypothetical protein [Natrinema halophilum]QLG50385.1 protein bicaudal D homolog [Natrinema halophilum]